MAIPTPHSHTPSAQTRAVPAQDGGQPDDIVEQVMADHRRIRRLTQVVHEAARDSGASDCLLADAWQRLADLLEVHTRAEEEICYLPMFGSGPTAAERRREAVSCHDDIRDAISETSLRPVGSPPWWRAAHAVLTAAAEHLDREERVIQASWIPRLTASTRRELGRQWSAFAVAWRQDAPATSASEAPYARNAQTYR